MPLGGVQRRQREQHLARPAAQVQVVGIVAQQAEDEGAAAFEVAPLQILLERVDGRLGGGPESMSLACCSSSVAA